MCYLYSSLTQLSFIIDCDKWEMCRCSYDDFGKWKSDIVLPEFRGDAKPQGVLSAALTVSNEQIILLDEYSRVFSIKLPQGTDETAIICSVCLTDETGNQTKLPKFMSVQTIGDPSIFFFQSQETIDIFDQNYCRLLCLDLNQSSSSIDYRLHVFTDFVDTYCLVIHLSSTPNIVYHLQNLVASSCIHRQESDKDLNKASKPIGNWLLDTIKWGELKFGFNASRKKTQYHMIVPNTDYNKIITQYFSDLQLSAELHFHQMSLDLLMTICDDPHEISRILLSRVPIQICTIEGGNLIPLCNGKRRTLDTIVEKQTFDIETKTKDILFSYLDSILNDINSDIRLIGIIGRQSTGKSYMMNRIFGTRFSVAAGRCTDGIWMNYAFVNNVHFLVFDCEGLFSNERTEDEEIKLIGFLAAMCDVTILNQDLSFDRYQDRLFVLLSETISKVVKSTDFFKGNLLVTIRDIADNEASDAHAAAYKKFVDIKNKGQDQFLAQLYSSEFSVHLLHHFENINFDQEIQALRDVLINNTCRATNRWPNGATLALLMKILLIQLYTNDFCDSRRIHLNILLAELEGEARTLWCSFQLPDSPSIPTNHDITVQLDNQSYSFDMDQHKLLLDHEDRLGNYERLCQLLSMCLNIHTNKNDINYKDVANRKWSVANETIPLIFDYRLAQVKEIMIDRFRTKVFVEDADYRETQCANFEKFINDYAAKFSVRICLQKCSLCDLLCTKIQKHTDELKYVLGQKKDELNSIEKTFGTGNSSKTDDIISMEKKLSDKSEQRQKIREKLVEVETMKRYIEKRTGLETKLTLKKADLKEIQEDMKRDEQALVEIKQQCHTQVIFENDILNSSNYTTYLFDQIKDLVSPAFYNSDELKAALRMFITDAKRLECWPNDAENKEEILVFPILSDVKDNRVPIEYIMKENLGNIERCIQVVTQVQTILNGQLASRSIQRDDMCNRLKHLSNHLAELQNSSNHHAMNKETLDQTKTIQQTQLEGLESEQQKLNLERVKVESSTTASLANLLLIYINILQEEKENNASVDNTKQQTDHSSDSDIIVLQSNTETRDGQCLDRLQNNKTSLSGSFVEIDPLESLMSWHTTLKKFEETSATTQQYLAAYQQRYEKINGDITQLESRISSEQDLVLKDILHEDLQIKQTEKNTCTEKIEKFQEQKSQAEEKTQVFCDQHPPLNDIISRQIPELCHNRLERIENRQNEVQQNVEKFASIINQLSQQLSDEEACISHLKTEIENKETEIDMLTTKQHEVAHFLDQYKQFLNRSIDLKRTLTYTKDKLMANKTRIIKLYFDDDQQQLLFTKANTILHNLRELIKRKRHAITDLKILEEQTATLQQPFSKRLINSAEHYYQQYSNMNEELIQIEQDISSIKFHLETIDKRSRIVKEILTLEQQVRSDCDCGTDHCCKHTCDNCEEPFPCMYRAGHGGKHKCSNGHACEATCQIYNCTNQCHLSYEHEGTHQCERVHQCTTMCICFKLCTIPLEVNNSHDEHRCDSTQCWKSCVLCERSCCTPDHNHDATVSKVTIMRNGTQSTVNAHICDQPHTCQAMCEVPGICGFEYKTSRAEWKTSMGCVFDYEKIDVTEIRRPCAVQIRPGFFQHSHHVRKHQCEVSTHTCTQRCPDCEVREIRFFSILHCENRENETDIESLCKA
ncbi:unnamed protein product [Rotaria sp. Silwood2]|nr:unnamed protein product [Rotaria sp. Silwood2]